MTTLRTELGEPSVALSCTEIDSGDTGDDDDPGDEQEARRECGEHATDTGNKFCVDYSKRGTAKCKICKKCIPTNELRIGAYVFFKGKTITSFHHVTCFFRKMKRARVASNVIRSPSDIDGFENISEADQQSIVKSIEEDKSERTTPISTTYGKRHKVTKISLGERRKKLKMMKTPSVKILFTNADQFTHAKKDELQQRIVTEKPMLIAVSEVKSKNGRDMNESDYSIEGYTINPTNLEKGTGRGIIIYTHNSLDKSAIQVWVSNPFEEACLVELRLRNGDTLLFGCIYRSPTQTNDSVENNDHLNKLLQELCAKSNSHICLVGDFNYRDINWNSWTTPHAEDSKESKFIEAVRDSFLFQHVQEPTRARGNDDPSLIDLILTNEEHQVSDVVHHAPLGKSDHSVITFNYHCYLDFSKPKTCYQYQKADFDAMVSELRSSNWTETFMLEARSKGPEASWELLKAKLLELRNKFVPTREIKTGIDGMKGNFPINKTVQLAIKEKHSLHRRWMKGKKRGSQCLQEAYNKSRSKVKKLIRQSKRLFEKGLASVSKSDPKRFWKYVRNKLRTKSGVAPLLHDKKNPNSLKFDDKEKAEILQDQFCSIFTKEQPGSTPVLEKRTEKEIRHLKIVEDSVRKQILALNINKSCGPDEVSPLLLIKLVDFVTGPLTKIMNESIECGVLPQDWKNAFVSPIYKKGARNLAENYRPISLTSIACKLMEKLVKDAVLCHLMENNLLSEKQYGFVNKRSTVTQLLSYLDKCAEVIASGGIVDSIYFDFSKAFDTVPHRRLSVKMKAYGIQGKLLTWIEAFLSGREQMVRVNGELSASKPVISGIPQGSVLGPLLFVLYINDLPDTVKSNVLLFADDTKIFKQVSCSDDATVLQEDIDALNRWSDMWLLKFNTDKCHVLTLGKFENITHTHRYSLYGDELDHVFEEKDLGVIIDMELTFGEHIATKVNKANGIMGLIRRTFSFLDGESFKMLYTSFVRPHLEYANPVWSPHLRKQIRMLENVQERATKLVDGMKHLSYPERLKKLDLPTLQHRRERGDMIQVWKHFNEYDRSTLPANFRPIPRVNRQHPYRLTRNRPKDGALGIQSNSFYFRVPNEWNNLQKRVVESENINTFKARIDATWADKPTKFTVETPSDTNDEERFGETF